MSVKRVLFVCVENSNRSQMAQAFARIHGGDGVDAYSAGSRPSGKVNPKAVVFEDDFDVECLSEYPPQLPKELKSVDAGVFFSSDPTIPDITARFSTDVQMFTVTFDCIAGQAKPAAGAFTCTVVSASTPDADTIPDEVCTLVVQ